MKKLKRIGILTLVLVGGYILLTNPWIFILAGAAGGVFLYRQTKKAQRMDTEEETLKQVQTLAEEKQEQNQAKVQFSKELEEILNQYGINLEKKESSQNEDDIIDVDVVVKSENDKKVSSEVEKPIVIGENLTKEKSNDSEIVVGDEKDSDHIKTISTPATRKEQYKKLREELKTINEQQAKIAVVDKEQAKIEATAQKIIARHKGRIIQRSNRRK